MCMNFLFTFKHGNFTMHYETRIQFKCSYVLFPDTIPGKKHLCRAFETIFYKLKFTTSFFVCARMLRNNDTRLPTIDDYDMITDYTIIQCTITQLYRLYNYIPHNNTFILIIHRGLHSQQNCTITQTSNLNTNFLQCLLGARLPRLRQQFTSVGRCAHNLWVPCPGSHDMAAYTT